MAACLVPCCRSGLQTVVVTTVFGEQYSDDGGKTFANSTGGGVSMSVRFLGANGDGGMKYGAAGTYMGPDLEQIQGTSYCYFCYCRRAYGQSIALFRFCNACGVRGCLGETSKENSLEGLSSSRPVPFAPVQVSACPSTVARPSRRTTLAWTPSRASVPSRRTRRGTSPQVRPKTQPALCGFVPVRGVRPAEGCFSAVSPLFRSSCASHLALVFFRSCHVPAWGLVCVTGVRHVAGRERRRSD